MGTHPSGPLPQKQASPALAKGCSRSGQDTGPPPVLGMPAGREGLCAHLCNVGQCAAIPMGELAMNGGNCSSLCPVSRRRQKPLLPRQTMPLCGRQRPAAHTSPALCEPPMATPGSGATASGALSQGATPPAPEEGWARAGRSPGPGTPGCHPARSVPSAGRPLWPEVQRREAAPPSFASRLGGGGGRGDINNSYTQEMSWEEAGRGEFWR